MKKKLLLSSILSIAMCASLISGATYALFTDEASVNISVSSGKVDVVATLESNLELYSMGRAQAGNTFENGGSATIAADGKLTLSNMTPGDMAVASITVANESTVSIQYRVKYAINGTLAPMLKVSTVAGTAVDNYVYTPAIATTAWETIAAGTDIADLKIAIELPEEVGNVAQGKTATVEFAVTAVQGNADVVSDVTVNETVTVDGENKTVNETTLASDDGKYEAVVPANVTLNAGSTGVTLNVASDAANAGNFYIEGATESVGLDICIPEVAANNQTAIIITLKDVLSAGLADVVMLHDGVRMNAVASAADVINADDYYYEATTGYVTLATTGFSNFTLIATDNADVDLEVYQPAYGAEDVKDLIAEDSNVIKLVQDVTLTEAITVAAGKEVTIDLNGYTLAFESSNHSGNYDAILVKGTLNITDGTITTIHKGVDLAWNNMTTILDITAGGEVNIENATLENLGGTSMAFVAHLNNWGEVTLNVENSTLKSTYIPLRVFNSGYDMNNVSIYNSTLEGVSRAIWVHNYTAKDFGSKYDAEAVEARLNFDFFGNNNTFIASDPSRIIEYGFSDAINYDANGNLVARSASQVKSYAEAGKDFRFGKDIEMEADITAPYGNKLGLVQNGGVIDGNGFTLSVECYGDDYAILTHGGTIKNLTIDAGCRAIVPYTPTEDVILDNVHINGDVLYPINTAELATVAGIDLIVSNSSFGGWTSFDGGFETATFTNCTFEVGGYGYGHTTDDLVKPYINTLFKDCKFICDCTSFGGYNQGYYIDLSALKEGCKVTFDNCTSDGTLVTASNYAEVFALIELPGGRTIADCVIFK